MQSNTPIHILGAGALGSLWASKLSLNNNVVLLLKQQRYNNSYSFEFVEQNNRTTITLPCETAATSQTSIQTLLVFTKSYDTRPAIDQIKHRLRPDSLIVLFQNGMGSQQEVISLLPNARFYAVTTTEAANRPDKNTVIYAGKGESWLGNLSNPVASDLKSLLAKLSQSSLTLHQTPEIWQRLWLKLTINCAINPFTALLNCPNGEIRDYDFFRTRITPLCHELSEAMSLNQQAISAENIRSLVDNVIEKTARNISSMLQDVRSGRQTEIDYINGYIDEVAKQQQRHFPVNNELLQAVREKFQP